MVPYDLELTSSIPDDFSGAEVQRRLRGGAEDSGDSEVLHQITQHFLDGLQQRRLERLYFIEHNNAVGNVSYLNEFLFRLWWLVDPDIIEEQLRSGPLR